MTDKKNTTPAQQVTTEAPTQHPSIAENTSFELVLPWSLVEPAYNQEVGHAASHLKMAGFRPGKVPASMAEKRVDQEHLVTHVLRKVAPALLEKKFAEEGSKYHPISQPSVHPLSTLKGADWKVKVSFAEPPVIKLGDYKKTVKAAKKASEKEVAEQEKALKEQSKKDKKDKKAPTELTDEQKKEVQLRFIFRDLVEGVKPAIPELLVREETEYRLQNFAQSLNQFKIELQDYLKRRGTTIEQIIAEFQAEALASLQLEFVLSEIGKTAKIEVSDADRKEALDAIKDEKLKAQYEKDQTYQNRLDNTIYRRKIIDHILSL